MWQFFIGNWLKTKLTIVEDLDYLNNLEIYSNITAFLRVKYKSQVLFPSLKVTSDTLHAVGLYAQHRPCFAWWHLVPKINLFWVRSTLHMWVDLNVSIRAYYESWTDLIKSNTTRLIHLMIQAVASDCVFA